MVIGFALGRTPIRTHPPPERGEVMKKILHLTLMKRWFDEIASGQKKIEYRDKKPYWEKRLEGKVFDEIHFKNGYAKDAPFMRVEWKGCVLKEEYEIKLGRVLEIKNNAL